MDYHEIVKHYENCYTLYGDTNKGIDWPNEEDALKRYAIMLDVIKFDELRGNIVDHPHILDFGCGLGHMYQYMKKHAKYSKYNYTGLDLSETYVDVCKSKFPNVNWQKCDILKERMDIQYDYIIANGVFTEKLEYSFDEMKSYFEAVIKQLYKITKHGLAFNVMSSHVDWERDDLFHMPMDMISDFIIREFTRNFIIRNDYGLYEYTLYVYKEGYEAI